MTLEEKKGGSLCDILFLFYFKRLQVFLIFQELEGGRGAVSDIVRASVLLVEIGPESV